MRMRKYVVPSHCHICGSNMIKGIELDTSTCKNKCYHIYYGYGWSNIYIFDKKIVTIWEDNLFNFIKIGALKRHIKKWKKNDKYLMKILGDL